VTETPEGSAGAPCPQHRTSGRALGLAGGGAAAAPRARSTWQRPAARLGRPGQVLALKKEEEERRRREEDAERARAAQEQDRLRRDREREARLKARLDEEVRGRGAWRTFRAYTHTDLFCVCVPTGASRCR